MKKKIAVLILGILLIGMTSASLVAYLSNIITGSVEVKGPVFYLSNEHPIGGTTYWGLGINNFIERTTPVSFTGSSNKLFISEKLGVSSFYAANYKINIEAESTNENGQIDARMYFIEGDNPYNKRGDICSGSVGSVYNKNVYTINCQTEELILDPNWRLVLELSDGMNEIQYKIYMEGNSKIEVSKA